MDKGCFIVIPEHAVDERNKMRYLGPGIGRNNKTEIKSQIVMQWINYGKK